MNPEKQFVPLADLVSLKNKKALVTGAAMGIGFAIAYRLAEAGAAVVVCDVNPEKGQAAAQKIQDSGYSASFIKCDVSRESEAVQAVESAVKTLGGIDILVNNAGIFPYLPLPTLYPPDIEKVISVNLSGMLYFTREVSRRMIEAQHSGCIINLASIDSLHPSHSGFALYDASKGAVLTLTKSLAKELGPSGIRVNAIAPGGILTEGAITQQGPGNSRAILKAFMARLPLGHMGKADDIGRVALFLASDLAGYITGSVIVADGGYLIS